MHSHIVPSNAAVKRAASSGNYGLLIAALVTFMIVAFYLVGAVANGSFTNTCAHSNATLQAQGTPTSTC